MLTSLSKLRRVSCKSVKIAITINIKSLEFGSYSSECPICVTMERKDKRKSTIPRKPQQKGATKVATFDDCISFYVTLFRQSNGAFLPKVEYLNIVEIVRQDGQQREFGVVALQLDAFAASTTTQRVVGRILKNDMDTGATLEFFATAKNADDIPLSDEDGTSNRDYLQLTWDQIDGSSSADELKADETLAMLEQENLELQRRLDSSELARNEMKKRIDILEDQAQRSEPLDADPTVIAGLEREKALLKRQVEQLSAQLMSLTNVMSETVESLQSDLQQQSERVIDLERENSALQGQVEFLSAQVVNMSSELGKTVELLQSGLQREQAKHLQLQQQQQQQQQQLQLQPDLAELEHERNRLQVCWLYFFRVIFSKCSLNDNNLPFFYALYFGCSKDLCIASFLWYHH